MFELIGLGFIQIFLFIIGSALGVVFAVAVSLSTRGISRGRRRAQVIAFVFPSIALFYLEAGFFSHALVREVLGEDNFLNGLYHYPLGNGYGDMTQQELDPFQFAAGSTTEPST